MIVGVKVVAVVVVAIVVGVVVAVAVAVVVVVVMPLLLLVAIVVGRGGLGIIEVIRRIGAPGKIGITRIGIIGEIIIAMEIGTIIFCGYGL